MPIELSCCTLGYVRSATLEDAISRIANLGYTGVDFYTGAPHLLPEDYSSKERANVAALVRKHKLALTGFAVGGGMLALQLNFSSHRPSLRRYTVKYYKDNLELAEELGAPLINVLTGNVPYGVSRREAMEWTMDALHELTAVAEKTKVIMGLHPQYVAESPLMTQVDDAIDMITDLKSRYVKIIFDTAQQNISNRNFEDDLRKCGRNLCYVHAADNDGVTWTHDACGKGTVNWHGIVRVLKEIGFNGRICVQAWSPLPNDVDTVMLESKVYLEKILKQHGVG